MRNSLMVIVSATILGLCSGCTSVVAGCGPELEDAHWRSVVNSTASADFETFLRRCPNGQYSAQARGRVRELQVLDDLRSLASMQRTRFVDAFPLLARPPVLGRPPAEGPTLGDSCNALSNAFEAIPLMDGDVPSTFQRYLVTRPRFRALEELIRAEPSNARLYLWRHRVNEEFQQLREMASTSAEAVHYVRSKLRAWGLKSLADEIYTSLMELRQQSVFVFYEGAIAAINTWGGPEIAKLMQLALGVHPYTLPGQTTAQIRYALDAMFGSQSETVTSLRLERLKECGVLGPDLLGIPRWATVRSHMVDLERRERLEERFMDRDAESPLDRDAESPLDRIRRLR